MLCDESEKARQALDVKVDYIHANPVRRGLVESPEQWPDSRFRQSVLNDMSGAFIRDGWEMMTLR